jgi:hypothetical protein
MIIREIPVDLTLQYPLEYDLDKTVFFDIETTGFAAETTYLYLIGCICRKASAFTLIQWFSEDPREEKNLLSLFFEFLKDYKVLLHYNGSGFDIPYLQRKCALHGLPHSFDDYESIDLYKIISPIKKLLKLDNYKQKSIEAFLNVNREDVSDGGELIQVYQSYIGKRHLERLKNSRSPQVERTAPSEADELLRLLLLHNEDDVKGLVQICPILYYADLISKPFHILQAGLDENKLSIRFELSYSLPVRVSYGSDMIYFAAYESSAQLTIQAYEGEMKYFYDNYRDYYYLPEEDTAVHKSVALFVDKEYRQKAKPSNCYTRKQGSFVPQYAPILSPVFKHTFQDKLSFLEVHTDFLLQETNLELYVIHILQHLITGKA